MVKRKSSEHKERLVARVREALDRHPRALVLRHRNMRNANLKDVRQYVKSRGGQVFLGSTKVLAVALGKDAPSEYKPNISQLSHRLKGHVALLITDMHLHDVHELLRETTAPQFARVGETAPESVSFSAGPLTWDGEEHVPASLEPRLRNLGLPVRLTVARLSSPRTSLCVVKMSALAKNRRLFSDSLVTLSRTSRWLWTAYGTSKAPKTATVRFTRHSKSYQSQMRRTSSCKCAGKCTN